MTTVAPPGVPTSTGTTLRTWSLSAAFVVLWSSGFLAADLAAGTAPPVTVLAWRFLLTAAPAAVWLALRAGRPTLPDLARQAVIALLGQSTYLAAVFCASAAGVPAGTTALITALQPVVVVVTVAIVRRRGVGLLRLAGLTLGLVGVGVVVAGDLRSGAAAVALLWPVAAVLALSAGTLLQQRWSAEGSVVTTLAWHHLVSAVFFTAWAGASGDLQPSAAGGFWLAVLWSAVPAGLGGYLTYYLVIRRRGADHASALIYLTPAATALWVWAVLGVPLRTTAVVGLVVSAAGVVLVLRGAPRPEPAD